jgi:hypothetical protein
MTAPKTPLEPPFNFDEEDLKLCVVMLNTIEEYRTTHRGTPMKDYELAKMSFHKLLQPTFERIAQEEPERLANMLTPEQRLAGITPEQLAKLLTPEQLMETLEALPPETREQIKQRLH